MQKQYWQHTGDGLSSRLAEHCLQMLGQDVGPASPNAGPSSLLPPGSPSSSRTSGAKAFSRNRHYSKKSSQALEAIMASTSAVPYNADSVDESSRTHNNGTNGQAMPGEDLSTYIEERYARNLSVTQAPLAKTALKRRIAGVLRERSDCSALPDGPSYTSPRSQGHLPSPSEPSDLSVSPSSRIGDASSRLRDGGDLSASVTSLQLATDAQQLQPSTRGITELTEDDVYLYPGGMSAIFHSFITILRASKFRSRKLQRPPAIGKSICFGFPYTDTLKILQKWGPGCHFFGRGIDEDFEDLEALLKQQRAKHQANPTSTDPEDQPILALYCEFPSNPLLRSPDLARLKALSDKYGFFIMIDETIGGFVNVECLPFADLVASSLTKVFSGDSNVMGGSLTLNPKSQHYELLKEAIAKDYEDTFYASDAIFLERNSRDFSSRVVKINRNAEAVCDFLQTRTVSSSSAKDKSVVTKVYYPKFITSQHYEARMRASVSTASQGSSVDAHEPSAGYGGLFSVTFTTLAASRAFFDTLKCCKGPSLGTNFTLACPYTVLAHYLELDWAREWEVEEGLVRVSIGLEDQETLLEWFTEAVEAAEQAEKDK